VDYHEFVCAGTTALFVATADPDPANIPAAAERCCQHWRHSKMFRLGDGTHPPALDAAIKMRVASDGYHLYLKRPC
jgi:xanthine/CO dehydrogenase XdhC/CoxF family maturation factor